MLLRKLPLPLHVEHEISTVHVLDDEEESADKEEDVTGLHRHGGKCQDVPDRRAAETRTLWTDPSDRHTLFVFSLTLNKATNLDNKVYIFLTTREKILWSEIMRGINLM